MRSFLPNARPNGLGKWLKKGWIPMTLSLRPVNKRTSSAKPTDEQSISPPPQTKKRTRKVLNKKERAELCDYLNSVDPTVLIDAAQGKLDEQLLNTM